ncbi:carboxypeptidase-like regulatory domain-containing protein [Flavobacterium pectinovorum]|uniref:Galactose oxidase n=1 Tax=Flavobacterium pectinovorum TaxID=29533 RepID=A0A502ELX9_9FLAO|nr:carboxypeptidase-like regulatory domain-containing protein [Flavobacterium pectinovorum]TPG38094.1 galactose oxidase [Flavobacterium pectinovorum]
MKKLLVILFLLPLVSIAQNIKGIVVSEKSGNPIADVNVFALFSNTNTLTSENGEFNFKLPNDFKEEGDFQFSHMGYVTKKISLADLRKLNFKIALSEEVENLSGLTVSGNQRAKLKSKLSYTKLAPLKYGIYSFGSVLNDGKIYITGGDATYKLESWEKIKRERPDFTIQDYLKELSIESNVEFYRSNLQIYDIKTDSWQYLKLNFKKRAYHNLNFYNNTLYVIGGKNISPNAVFQYLENEIEVFDLNNQTIKIDKTYPHQASNAVSITYKDDIIIMGGSTKAKEKGSTAFTNKVHLYNINSGYWYELASMPTAKETSGVLVGDKIYLIGGNNGNPISEIETFDLITEKWQTEGELFSGLEKPAVTCHDNIIYFFENRKMYVYDIKSKQLKEYIVDLGLKDSAMYFDNNKLYILGGSMQSNNSKTPTSNVYSIAIDEFETTKPDHIKIIAQNSNLVKEIE